jgi:hypothetical protein
MQVMNQLGLQSQSFDPHFGLRSHTLYALACEKHIFHNRNRKTNFNIIKANIIN